MERTYLVTVTTTANTVHTHQCSEVDVNQYTVFVQFSKDHVITYSRNHLISFEIKELKP